MGSSSTAASQREFTVTAVALGVIVGTVMTAANVYLGLYAGMTVSASIPAAVIAMGLFRVLRRQSILESNIVQTIASAGESLAAGVIFTIPALVLVGAWNEFRFWPTTLIAVCGGLLGVIFMIPLRRALIVEHEELTYPEGVACAAVLEAGGGEAGAKHGLATILKGVGIGGLVKFGVTGLGLLAGGVHWAGRAAGRVLFVGLDVSPALISVGYIVRLEIALLIFIGGAIGWFVAVPLLGIPAGATGDATDIAMQLWSTKVRYLGVGAMITGGVWSIISVRKGIAAGVAGLKSSYQSDRTGDVPRTEQNVPLMRLLVMFAIAAGIMAALYEYLMHQLAWSLFATVIMLVVSFFIVAVASYICGLVGSSNSPVSGMTISALLGTAALFLVLGYEGENAILATLGVAAVVCCAACTSGDCSQDLKTGLLVKATPKHQQYAQFIGVVLPAFVIAPVLTILHSSYTIGSPQLNAPQATLFASLTKGIFGHGDLPYDMVLLGVILGAAIVAADLVVKRTGSRFRLHVMPLAVGIYLPVTLGVTILLGGLIREFADRASGARGETLDRGVLLASGLIAGEAIIGVLLAVVMYFEVDLSISGIPEFVISPLSLIVLLLVGAYLYRAATRPPEGAE